MTNADTRCADSVHQFPQLTIIIRTMLVLSNELLSGLAAPAVVSWWSICSHWTCLFYGGGCRLLFRSWHLSVTIVLLLSRSPRGT